MCCSGTLCGTGALPVLGASADEGKGKKGAGAWARGEWEKRTE